MKLLAAAAIVLLCTPALAAPPSKPLQITVDVQVGGEIRHYSTTLVDDRCGRLGAKTAAVDDNVKLCPHLDGNQIRLDLDWTTRQTFKDGSFTEALVQTTLVLARGEKASLESNTAKLALALQ